MEAVVVITAEGLRTLQPSTVTRSWDSDDCLLYALGVGAGSVDPTAEIEFTTENSRDTPQRVVPTYGIILCGGGPEVFAPAGVRQEDCLLVSERLELSRPLPVSGTVSVEHVVSEVREHPRGFLVGVENTARDESDAVVCRTQASTLVMTKAKPDGSGQRRAFEAPQDLTERMQIHVPMNQALVYRLTAGRNPLHSDPAVSREGGHDIPILHGRCTLGFVVRALISSRLGGDGDRLTSLEGKFIGPVFPGDDLTLLTSAKEGDGSYALVRESRRELVMKGSFECSN